MYHKRSNRPVPRAVALLDDKQKGIIARVANEAYVKHEALDLTENLSRDDWRRKECLAVCGTASLTQVTQRWFPSLLNHFEGLAGKSRMGVTSGLDAPEGQDWKTAYSLLRKEVAAKGFHWNYVVAIAKSQYRTCVERCTTAQLWQLVYTVRSRTAKTQPEAGRQRPGSCRQNEEHRAGGIERPLVLTPA